MPHLDVLAVVVVAVCAVLYGVSKTAMPVAGVVAGTVLAGVLGPAQATGFVVPLLILGDLIGLAFYRSHADWRVIIRVIPGVLVGFVLTALMFVFVPPAGVARIVGVLILISLSLELRRRVLARRQENAGAPHKPDHHIVTAMYGALAGMTTMGANAGGTAMSIYLIRLRVPMLAFMGTSAWFFFILNMCKVPFVLGLGYLTWDSLQTDVWFTLPLVAGALLGAFVFRRMTPEWFIRIALGLSGLAAVWLIIVG